MKTKKLMALLLCIFAVAALCSAVSVAADCAHPQLRWETVLQTCTKEGVEKGYCTSCGELVKTELIPMHNYNTIYISKHANCREEGARTLYCSWCKSLKNETIPVNPSNHDFSAWSITKEATCTEEGEKIRFCMREGCDYRETAVVPVDMSKHIAKEGSEWEIVTPSTCYSEGVRKNICGVCGEEFTATLAAHYDYADTSKYTVVSVTEANCTQAAATKYLCSVCGGSFTVTGEKDYDKHDFTDESRWVYTPGANCQNPGYIEKHCKYTYAHTVEQVYAPHDFSGEEKIVTPAGCKNDGVKTVQCIFCTETKTETIPAEHIFGEWVIESGNCKDGGIASRSCVCGELVENNVPFSAGTHLNYDVLADDKPDCENIGWQKIKCRICQEITDFFPEDYDALGHKSGVWTTVEEATCEKAGQEQRVCLTCGKVLESRTLIQRTHNFIILEPGVEATCTTAGITPYRYCTLCRTAFVQDTVPALGHNFVQQSSPDENGVLICDRCFEYKVGEGEASTCNCLCHNSNGLAKTLFKFINFIYKLFGIKQECNCGAIHYDASTSIFQDIFNK